MRNSTACDWDVYEAKLNVLGYDEYDNETLIGERVHNFVQLKSLNTVVALVEIGLGISCVVCNTLVLRHYIRRYREVTPLLYSALLSVDLLAGLGAVLQGITLLLLSYTFHDNSSSPTRSNSTTFQNLVPITYTLNSLTSHTSVFYSTVLVSARTLMITKPRSRAGTSPALVALLVGYPAFWLAVILWEVWIESVFWEDNTMEMKIDLFVVIPTTLGSLDYYLGYVWTCEPLTPAVSSVLSHVIPYGAPSLVSGAVTVVQVHFLGHMDKFSKKYRRVSVTVLILTAVFLVCNTAQVVTVVTIDSLNLEYTTSQYYFHYLVVTMLPVINSFINPLVLLIRGSVFKKKTGKSTSNTFSMGHKE